MANKCTIGSTKHITVNIFVVFQKYDEPILNAKFTINKKFQ